MIFSHVRDVDVLKIDSVIEAVFIVKQIYYAFDSENATDNPGDRYEVAATIDEEDAVLGHPVNIDPPPPPPPEDIIIRQLKDIITNRESDAHTASFLNKSIQEANRDVKKYTGYYFEYCGCYESTGRIH